MGGKIPKPPEERRRRNKVVTAAAFSASPLWSVPELPFREGKEWHRFTLDWWQSVQECEMRKEFIASDLHGLYLLADLVDDFWWWDAADGSIRGKATLAAEIRLQGMRYGLSPIDRRRLSWGIRGQEADGAKEGRLLSVANDAWGSGSAAD